MRPRAMPHYDTAEWTDFVRGLIGDPKAGEMESHLASCVACHRAVGVLREVLEVAQVDRRLEPPDHLVRWARALFSSERAVASARGARPFIAQLVYDSLAAPELAGMRAQHRISRHLLYEAGVFGLDLRLEYQRGSPRVTLVGQILDRQRPERSMSDVSVQLVRGRTEIGRGACNRFGEFQVDFEPDGRLRLYVMEGSRSRRIGVSLNGLQSEQPHG
jgi:hypothetical protein